MGFFFTKCCKQRVWLQLHVFLWFLHFQLKMQFHVFVSKRSTVISKGRPAQYCPYGQVFLIVNADKSSFKHYVHLKGGKGI